MVKFHGCLKLGSTVFLSTFLLLHCFCSSRELRMALSYISSPSRALAHGSNYEVHVTQPDHDRDRNGWSLLLHQNAWTTAPLSTFYDATAPRQVDSVGCWFRAKSTEEARRRSSYSMFHVVEIRSACFSEEAWERDETVGFLRLVFSVLPVRAAFMPHCVLPSELVHPSSEPILCSQAQRDHMLSSEVVKS